MSAESSANTRDQRPGVLSPGFWARNWGFMLCLIMLSTFAVSFQLMGMKLKIQHRKLPLELKKPLNLLDTNKLTGYKVKHVQEIKPEVLDSLGTDQYIQWILQDTSKAERPDPADVVHLFITYYTGQPDQVPHVPEECYSGAGYPVDNASYIDIPIPALGPDFKVKFQVLEMETPGFMSGAKRIVIYTFHTNGQFCPDRRCVQLAVGNPYDKYAYFSKLELTFGFPDLLPNKEDAIKSGTKFLQKIIPVLLQDHWPDWKKATTTDNAVETAPASAPQQTSLSDTRGQTG